MRNITRNNYDPHIGDYHNVIVHDTVRGKIWLFDCDGVFLDMSKTNVTVVDEYGESVEYAASQSLVTRTHDTLDTKIEGVDEASHDRDDILDGKIADEVELRASEDARLDREAKAREQDIIDDYTAKYQSLDNDIETLTRVTDGLTTDVENIERTAVFGTTLNQGDGSKIDLVVNDGGTTTTTTIRNAGTAQSGLMSAADYNQLAENTDAIQHLQNAGLYRGSFATINDAPTHTPDPAFVNGECFNNDYVSIQTATHEGETGSARYRAFVDDNGDITYTFEIFIDKDILPFSTGNLGLIKGAASGDGSIEANNDGTGSVIGWSTLSSQVSTNTNNIATNAGNITSLNTRMGTAEGNITNLDARVGTAEGNITSLTTRVGTAEGNITTNSNAITTINGKGVQATTDTTLGANTENLLTVKGMMRQWVDITNTGLPASPDPDVFYYVVES